MSSTTGILGFDTVNNHYRKLVCNVDGELKVEQSGSPVLPSGSSTLAEQQIQTTRLTAIDTTLSGFTCDTSAVTVSSSVLPTGGSTLAEQQGQTAHLATIADDTTSLDSKVVACNTGAVVVSSSALPTGASTLAEQQTQTTHLATLANTVNAGGEQKVSVSSENFGTHNNLANNITLNAGATTASLNISEIAIGNLFYQDGSVASNEGLEVEVSVDNTNWYSWGVILPYLTGGVRKENISNASAHGLRYIRLKNLSTTVNYTNVNATITGSH
jgi:hypothetical protein